MKTNSHVSDNPPQGHHDSKPDEKLNHERKDRQVLRTNHGELFSSGVGVSRRHFLKLAMTGTASAFLLPSCAIPKSNASTLQDPSIIRESPQNEANPIRLPDGSLVIYYMERNNHVTSIRSGDNGLTWSKEPKVEFTVSGETGYVCRSLLDHNGETHIWFIQRGEEHPRLPGNRQFDIWHCHTVNNHSAWAEPERVWEGYCGAIRDVLQMENGRIIVPFGAWKTGSEALPDKTGSNYTTVIYSDDNGATWQQSSAALTSPVYDGYNGNNYGACEPCITRLADGRLWMLIRTQTGVLYESFSDDGINWTDAAPSRFATSNSPAAFVKQDNRIIVFWNNHQLPPRVDGNGVYGGRDALHAAVSDDNGQTWHGFREVYLDPTRNESPPRRGDRGTAYPNGEITADGNIILVTGQGSHARKIIRFHPDWLYEKTRQHEFTSDGLEDWCVYKGIGPAQGWWRDRIVGAQLVAHPDKRDAQVLHVRRPDDHDPDGATWNFPAGRQGTLTLRMRINKGFGGAQISLADRLFDPTDDQGEQLSMFQLLVDSDGGIGEQAALTPDRWYTVRFDWNLEEEDCAVKIDENPAVQLPLKNPTANSISYLRVRSTARLVDRKGLFVETVEAEIA